MMRLIMEGEDVFVLRLSNNGDNIIFSTYMGGSGDERGISLALDDTTCVYVTGWTNSANFPVINAFDSTYNGEKDIFVFKFNALGSLLYSTFIGGASSEVGNSIVIDSIHCAYITGWTNSANFTTSSNSIGSSINHATDVILLKLNDAGNNLEYSFMFGGSGDDVGNSMALDENLTAYITGWTQSTDFPVTLNAFDDTLSGNRDAFVTVINILHNDMFYSTFWGGSDNDVGYSLVLDEYHRIYMIGWTNSDDFPITNGSFDTSYNGNGDVFYSKMKQVQ